jgi:hypothetical protein
VFRQIHLALPSDLETDAVNGPKGIDVPGSRLLRSASEGTVRMQVTTIGLDIAKRVFQAQAVDKACRAVLRLKLQRAEVLTFF